jgi:putative membrane protein
MPLHDRPERSIGVTMYGWHHGVWGWWWMPAMMLLTLVVVVVFVWVLVSWARTNQPGPPGPQTHRPGPEEILAERFARGELDANEYRERLAVMREDASRRP